MVCAGKVSTGFQALADLVMATHALPKGKSTVGAGPQRARTSPQLLGPLYIERRAKVRIKWLILRKALIITMQATIGMAMSNTQVGEHSSQKLLETAMLTTNVGNLGEAVWLDKPASINSTLGLDGAFGINVTASVSLG
jgi:hypothetical protein